jgi:hypothetical protein
MSHRIGLGVPMPQMLPVTGGWILPFTLYNLFLGARVTNERIKHDK